MTMSDPNALKEWGERVRRDIAEYVAQRCLSRAGFVLAADFIASAKMEAASICATLPPVSVPAWSEAEWEALDWSLERAINFENSWPTEPQYNFFKETLRAIQQSRPKPEGV